MYTVVCSDGSIYTGITTDVGRRVWEHNYSVRGARYTKSRRPVRLLYSRGFPTRSAASKEEWSMKSKTKKHKESVVTTELSNIFDARREALREIVGAVNTCIQEGDVIENLFICTGDDNAIIELNNGAYLTVNLGVIGADHAKTIMGKEREALIRLDPQGDK